MRVEHVECREYRNMEVFALEPCAGVNVIYGENAVGKTNVLESMWLCTGEKSFRGNTDGELIRFGSTKATVHCKFYAAGREQECELIIQNGKRDASLNRIALKSPTELTGRFYGVIFSPNHLALVQNGPDERRKFMDSAICQIKPGYGRVLANYKRALEQRGKLLKDIPYQTHLLETLDIWDEHLARLGGHVAAGRVRYIKRLAPRVGDIYNGISDGREIFSISYLSQTFDPECEDPAVQTSLFREKLLDTRRQDIEAGHTGLGTHRDDLGMRIDGASARAFGSQGQKRSCVLALKLGEAHLLRDTVDETPVVFLDDVMSELDEGRQNYLLHHLDGWQIFITSSVKLYPYRREEFEGQEKPDAKLIHFLSGPKGPSAEEEDLE